MGGVVKGNRLLNLLVVIGSVMSGKVVHSLRTNLRGREQLDLKDERGIGWNGSRVTPPGLTLGRDAFLRRAVSRKRGAHGWWNSRGRESSAQVAEPGLGGGGRLETPRQTEIRGGGLKAEKNPQLPCCR